MIYHFIEYLIHTFHFIGQIKTVLVQREKSTDDFSLIQKNHFLFPGDD
jgi:hypothetical protein